MTYENCYEILSEVRRGINEFTTAYVQGTDATGAYTNAQIFKAINDAQRYLYGLIVNRNPQLFFKSADLTPSAGRLTMPWDFYRIRRLENADGTRLVVEGLDQKPGDEESESSFHFYWQGGYIYMDDVSYSEVVKLYYVSKPRDIHSGMTSAGGALSATLDVAQAKKLIDYYNGMGIENITDVGAPDTISDYTAALVAVVSGTWAASKYYGLVSELPEPFHGFIARRATLWMRSTYKSLEKPTVMDIALFREDLNEALNSYFGTFNIDTPVSDLFE
jgi:hypothetical protein